MRLVDIGANLAHESFDADRAEVLERAWAAGVDRLVITGSSAASLRRALDLAHGLPLRLFATAGVRPHHAEEWNEVLADEIRDLSTDLQLVALGECGLDYFRDLCPRPVQRRSFEAQLRLAVELRKPVFLHQRDAHADFLAILRDYRPALGAVCVHCFTDTAAAAADYLALDCHLGITGWICDERRGGHLAEVVRQIPAGRLMVETDAPYLLPRTLPKAQRPRDGRRNEPAFLPWVVAAVAQARGESPEVVAEHTTRTACAFFGLH